MTARRRDERGAVAIIVAVLMAVVLVAVAAIAVDLGLQRVARSDMQSLADVVALDLARELDGRSADEINPTLAALAAASKSRNTSTVGDAPELTTQLGIIDEATGAFTTVTGDEIPNAVRVAAKTRVNFVFGLATRGGAERSAIASANPGACIKIGSSTLDLNSGSSSLLGPILNDALGLSVLSYNGLANTQLTLGDLALALDAGTTDELLATQVTAGQFYAAIVEAVTNDDDTANDGVINVLNAQILQSINANGTLQHFTVGELLSLGDGDDAALSSTLNVVDLVTASAFLANGENALAIPSLTLPAGITASLYVIEPPKLACRRGVAETSQLRLVLKQSLPVVSLLGLNVATVNLEITLNLAKAKGGIGSVTCANGQATAVQVRMDQQTLVDLDVKLDVKLLGLPVTSAYIPTNVPAQGSAGTHTVPLPQYYDQVFHIPGSGTIGIPNVTGAQLSLLGINLGAVAGLVVGVVNPALAVVTGLITNTITPLLGLRLAGADVFAIRTADCLNPTLVG